MAVVEIIFALLNQLDMQNIQFKVEMPALLERFIGLKSKVFSGNNNIEESKNNALKYFSEAIIKSVEVGSIWVSEFVDESAQLERVNHLNRKPYINNDGVLNFPKLLQCKIEYRYSEDFVFQLIIAQQSGKKAVEILKSLGTIQLSLCLNDDEVMGLIAFSNQLNNKLDQRRFELANKQKDLDIFFKRSDFLPQYSFNFEYEKRLNSELFYSKNFYNKTILKEQNFFELEKQFLSMMNTGIESNYIFILEKYVHNAKLALQRLIQTYNVKVKVKRKKSILF